MRYLLKIYLAVSLLLTGYIFSQEPEQQKDTGNSVKLTQKELRKFTGNYRGENGEIIRIKRQNEKLYAYNFLAEKWELEPLSATQFRLGKSTTANYLQFYLVKGKVMGYLTCDFKRNRAIKFTRINHFVFYKREYLIILAFFSILIFFAILKKNGYIMDDEVMINYKKWKSWRIY